ncbi:MAG: hypothetical protein J5726_05205 [Treponema sp.]|nr:hypothetical protein [Treponema sp.]
MKGSYEVIVKNRRIQYKFTISRNITILKGDSATGKTTLIDMIQAYQNDSDSSGVSITSTCPCVVLTSNNWELNLSAINNSIVFIDEGNAFVNSEDFAKAAKASSNYYVIATRNNLFNLPYSVTEIYGIKNISGNKYQQTKRLYSSFYKLYDNPKIFSWELFFTDLLKKSTNGTYLEYSKTKLNSAYLQDKESKAIMGQIPKMF